MATSQIPDHKILKLSPKEKISLAIGTLSGMKDVERLVESKFKSEATLLNEIPKYLFTLGGKRIRPIICLLVAQALRQRTPSQPLIDVAAGIELIHMATLLHDDIIDKSPLRRHEESPFIKYGTGDTLLAGDFLLVRAFSLCARLDRFIIDATETACIELTEGEILEVALNKKSHTLESSLTISRKKTASLFSLAAKSAAWIATDGKMDLVNCFTEFGEALGIAFQVLDDILDVISSEDLLGKKAGIDILERKPSPVNVLWLQSGSHLAKKLLTEEQPPSQEDIEAALMELKSGSVISDATAIAKSYADKAQSALEKAQTLSGGLEHKAFEALKALVAYVLERME